MDAHNPFIDGPRENTEPVFVIPWNQGASQTEQEREAERQRYVTWYRTRWMSDPSRYPEHHIFPRALREQFGALGVNVDVFTILVDPDKHARCHSEQGLYGPGGLWNWEWKQWLAARRAKKPDLGEIWKKAFEMLDRHRLAPHGPLCPYRCGRDLVHDPFDVEARASVGGG